MPQENKSSAEREYDAIVAKRMFDNMRANDSFTASEETEAAGPEPRVDTGPLVKAPAGSGDEEALQGGDGAQQEGALPDMEVHQEEYGKSPFQDTLTDYLAHGIMPKPMVEGRRCKFCMQAIPDDRDTYTCDRCWEVDHRLEQFANTMAGRQRLLDVLNKPA